MFTIIIPLYNKAPYIRKAIESVFAQTCQEFELIVVDDGSTDDSFAQISDLRSQLSVEEPDQFKKIKIIQQENQGVSTTRNNGVQLAKYDYIAFLDADDWWEPTYLEKMRGLIERYPQAELYSSSYYKVVSGKLIPANIGVEKEFIDGIIDYCNVYSKTMYQPVWTGAAVVKKAVFYMEKGFKPKLKMGEDFDLWLRIALKYPIALLNTPLAYYNQDVEQVNRAIGTKFYEPEQHMLFSDYSHLKQNAEFTHLYEVLALYGLLPYYLSGKNKDHVARILREIHWENHSNKYKLFYRILPKIVVRYWLWINRVGARVKKMVVSNKVLISK